MISVNGVHLHYEETGAGPESMVFAHGLLWSGWMFREQVAALRERYRCITFDFRGQGESELARAGYDMDTLTEDAAGLVQALGAAPCHFLGLSMGGFVGMRLAARRPELVRSLILLETSADAEPPENVPRYKKLSFIARWLSVRLVLAKVMAIMFGRKFLADPSRAELREECRRRLLANNRIGTGRATLGVITRLPVYEEIARISVPTLILVGDQDVATPPFKSRRIQERIPSARLVIVPGAGHSSTIEEPAAVNSALIEFLNSLGDRSPQR
jgi:pimeloyl-ACP methyl ester carboxylesterase